MRTYLRILTLSLFAFCLVAKEQLLAQSQTGKASYYAGKFHGRATASGEIYDSLKLTAAHNTLPFGTKIKVTNLKNNKSIEVVVNDRGPFKSARIVDLSQAAADSIDMIIDGIANVTLDVVLKDIDVAKTEQPKFFHIKITQAQPAGYGVQIMSFSQTDNYVAFVEQLQEKFESQNIMLHTKNVNGQKVIGVILQQFASRDEAETLRTALQGDYPDCYIVDFSKFYNAESSTDIKEEAPAEEELKVVEESKVEEQPVVNETAKEEQPATEAPKQPNEVKDQSAAEVAPEQIEEDNQEVPEPAAPVLNPEEEEE